MKEKTKLQMLRERQGMTATEVRKRTNIPRVSYYRYEQEQRIPDAVTAIKIAQTLNSTVEEIWGREQTVL